MNRIILTLILSLLSHVSTIHSESVSNLEILLSSNNSIYLSTLKNIQSISKQKLNLTFTNSLGESELKDFFNNLEKNDTSLLITLGPQASLLAKENLKNTPILYSLINSPRALGFNSQTKSCGVHMDVPITEFFKTLKEIKPDANKIASIISNSTGELLVNEADYKDSQFQIIFHKIKVKSNSEFAQKLYSLKGKIDAFYMVPDAIYNSENFELVSKFSKENNIILMTQIPFIVNVGTTFSITPYHARIGTMIGEMANDIISGKIECNNGYAISGKEFSFTFNKAYAEESGLSVPKNILNRSENNRLLIQGINFYEKGNNEVSSLIMQKILKEDPNNSTALYYKNFMNQKMNGNKIQDLLTQAKEYKESKNFRKERELYLQIFILQAENITAKQGYQESLFLESESEREEGEKLEASKNIFASIQKYLNSLKILDSNAKSKANLKNLRQKELPNVSNYIQKGKSFYENRKYENAEEVFQNVLLIDPDNKNAKEYLRLSIEKKTAMLKYENCIKEADKRCYLLWKK